MRPPSVRFLATLIPAALAIACHDSGPLGGGTGVKPAFLAVEPPHVTTTTRFPVRFTWALRDSSGQNVASAIGKSPIWSIDDPAVATVSQSGVATQLRPGLTRIRAQLDGVSGFAIVQVLPSVAYIAITPDSADAYYDRPARLTAVARDSNNTPLTRNLTWHSSDSTIAAVSDIGAVTPLKNGVVRISASADSTSGAVTVLAHLDHVTLVTVTSPGGATAVSLGSTLQLSAALTGVSFPTSGFPIRWATLDSARARVGPTGLVTPVAMGSTAIVATAAGVADTFPVRIDPPVASVVIVPDTLQVTLGQRGGLAAYARDSVGHVLTGHAIKFSTQDSTIAPFVDSVTVSGAGLGSTVLFATTDAVRASGLIRTDTLSLVWMPGGTVTLDVGNPNYGATLEGPANTRVSIRSSDTTVLQINVGDTVLNTAVGMHLEARSAGLATITARVAKFAPVALRADVLAPELTGFTVSPNPGPLAPGDTVQLNSAEGSHGTFLYYHVTWQSSDPAIATVDTTGLVIARGPGRAGIIASVLNRADTVRLYVRAPTAPTLLSISDSAVAAGDTFTIKGTALGSAAQDTIWVAGHAGQVLSATDTQLVAVAPTSDQYACASPGPVDLRVTVGREYRDTIIPFHVAAVVSLAPEGILRLTGAPARCVGFPLTYSQYLVGVGNTGTVPQSFQVQVDTPGAEQIAPPSNWPSAPRPGGPLTIQGRNPLGLARVVPGRVLGVAQAFRLRQRAGLRAMASPVTPLSEISPGSSAVMNVPVLDAPDPCSSYTQIQARTVFSGAHVVVMEDQEAPLAGSMDDVLTQAGSDFDTHAFGVLSNNLGDPLAAFPTGKIVILLTPQVNGYGTDAFATGCDFYAPSVAPASNQAPVVYVASPTDPGVGYNAFTRQAWAWTVPTDIVSVGASLTTFGVRLSAGAPPEEVWLDEAIAEAAVEIWDRQFSGAAWKGNTNYVSSLYCEVRPAFPNCAGHPFAMFSMFENLYAYDLLAPYHSATGHGAPDDFTFAAGAWWLLRATMDHYASSEGGFLSALVHEPRLTGLANLSARAGAPAGALLSEWMIFSYCAGNAAFLLPPSLAATSWNSWDVFTGMNGDFPDLFTGFPLTFLPLSGTQTFYGGGAAVGTFSVDVPSQALGLTSASGGIADPSLYVTILRVH